MPFKTSPNYTKKDKNISLNFQSQQLFGEAKVHISCINVKTEKQPHQNTLTLHISFFAEIVTSEGKRTVIAETQNTLKKKKRSGWE